MKNIITGLIAIAAFTFSANAQSTDQDNQTRDNYSKDRGERNRAMMEKLNLTDSQKDQMKSINQDYRSRMETLKQNTTLSESDMRAQRRSLEQERNEKIAGILTPDQRSRFETMRKERQEDRQGTTGQWNNQNNSQNNNQNGYQTQSDNRGDQRMDRMKEDLGLSDDQMARLKNNNESFRERARSISDNQSLSADDKKMQFEKLRMERQESMRGILTADQYAKMESMNKGRKEKIKDQYGKDKINENGKEKIKVKDNN